MSETATKTDEQRCASYFWTLLGKPEEFNNDETVSQWSKTIRDCMGEADIDRVGFKRFLHWALEENALSAKYLRLAHDPAATLAKNLPTLLKRYKAHAKAQEILSRKEKKNNPDLPKYRQESGKKEVFKDSGL